MSGKTGPASMAAAGRHALDAGTSAAETASALGMNAFGDFTRLLSEMKLPAMPDMQAMMAVHRRNIETLTAANRVAMEGAQAIARRNMELMQRAMAELTETMQAVTSAEGPQAKAARQTELLKRSYEHAITNMREMSELIQRANGEALALLNQRFSEAMDEVRGLMERPPA